MAGLRDAFAACESLMPVELETVIDVVKEAHVEQDGTNCCSRSAFPRVAMHYNHVVWPLSEPLKRLFGYPVEVVEGWTVVVGPVVFGRSSPKILVLIISGSLRRVDDPVSVCMPLIQEGRHVLDVVSVHSLHP